MKFKLEWRNQWRHHVCAVRQSIHIIYWAAVRHWWSQACWGTAQTGRSCRASACEWASRLCLYVSAMVHSLLQQFRRIRWNATVRGDVWARKQSLQLHQDSHLAFPFTTFRDRNGTWQFNRDAAQWECERISRPLSRPPHPRSHPFTNRNNFY